MEKNILKTKDDVLKLLDSKNLQYKVYDHAPALTIDDLKQDPGKFDKSPFVKNLIWVEKKTHRLFFVIANGDTTVGKECWKKIGTNKNKLRFAGPDKLESLHAIKGSVSVFNVLNDTENKVPKVYFDKELEKEEYWNFHPQTNEASIELSQKDVLGLLKDYEKEYEFVNLVDDENNKVENQKDQKQKKSKQKKDKSKDDKNVKGQTKEKITANKTDEFSEWYSQVITKADMIDYYNVSGCYVLKPNSYFVWEKIQYYLDQEFKKLGVKNVYFPMFVSKTNLEKEEKHLEGFQAEVAWVTHYGTSKLNDPVAIRPTSETIMYPHYADWIQSHRDLPMLYNQWTNIVRWEFKHPTPFIRTREFLWQEGHTAHVDEQDSSNFVFKILDVYADTYKTLLAIPVIKGIKSENEKFAGADFTSTCETFIVENGRAIQACTSHQLGKNFAKMFNIYYTDENQEQKLVSQTSWGFTTRSIGIVVMMHGDNQGLVLPPKVAPVQVVIVPLYFKNKTEEVNKKSFEVQKELQSKGFRVEVDDRETLKPGKKYNEWEMKGVPLRIEIGPKDLEKQEVRVVRRVDNIKQQVKVDELCNKMEGMLQDIHDTMYKKAEEKMFQKIVKADNWKDFMLELNKMQVIKTPWCMNEQCEDEVKDKSKKESEDQEDVKLSGSAKTLCMPLEQEDIKEDLKCFHCEEKAKKWVLWGRSY